MIIRALTARVNICYSIQIIKPGKTGVKNRVIEVIRQIKRQIEEL